jgi:lipopolysaccharide biosynthesis glycosyltransferase
MTIVFTLCSKNYLAQATTLYDSFKKYNPDIFFSIGLVDKLNEAEALQMKNYEITDLETVDSEAIRSMFNRYNIIELNTAVKPYYIDYFFKKYNAEKVIYFDPDILITHSISHLTEKLDTCSYILTPHFCTPIYDDRMLTEQITLQTGTFNLGFFAVKNDDTGKALINWLSRKLYDECIMDFSRGYFVDQKWMNLSICHFDNFFIDKHPGLNMAHWNLHERNLSLNEKGEYIVNNKFPLIFFHFSSFKPEKPGVIADWQNRFTFESRPDIQPLFSDYISRLKEHQYETIRKWKPEYGLPVHKPVKNKLKTKIKRKVIELVEKV